MRFLKLPYFRCSHDFFTADGSDLGSELTGPHCFHVCDGATVHAFRRYYLFFFFYALSVIDAQGKQITTASARCRNYKAATEELQAVALAMIIPALKQSEYAQTPKKPVATCEN